jgi:hypothetical protein
MAYFDLAELELVQDRPGEAMKHGEHGGAIAEQLDDDGLRASAIAIVGAAQATSLPEESAARIEEALVLAARSGVSDSEIARFHVHSTHAKMQMLALEKALEAARRGIAFCSAHDLDVWRDFLLGSKAQIELWLGRWDEAERSIHPVLLNEGVGLLARNPAMRVLASLQIRRGDSAEDAMAELDHHMSTGREWSRFASYVLVRAEQAWLSGSRIDEVMSLIGECLAESRGHESPYLIDRLKFWRRRLSGGQGNAPSKRCWSMTPAGATRRQPGPGSRCRSSTRSR